MPITVGVYVTEQVPPLRVHGEVVNVPVPLDEKLTVPVGVLAVPRAVSATVTVHVVTLFTTIDAGAQVMVVDVERRVTVTVVVAFAGALWLVSPP